LKRSRWRRANALGVVFIASAIVGAGSNARAYVRAVTDVGVPMCWSRPDIRLTLAAGAALPELDRDSLIEATRAAADVWNNAAKPGPSGSPVRCSQLQLSIDVSDVRRADAKQDADNQISFRQDIWHREPCDPMVDKQCGPYDPAALAITSTYAHTHDGTIVGGDVELNGINFAWADLQKRPELRAMHQDVQNALTHELGHFIGLDHTCYMQNGKAPPTDNHGQQIPNCGPKAPPDVQATTMYASADPGDLSKRDLAPDDTDAVCDLFPAGKALPCSPAAEGKGGCAIAGSGGRGGAGFAIVAAAAALLVGRRRRSAVKRR
jgi:hypothetical protein